MAGQANKAIRITSAACLSAWLRRPGLRENILKRAVASVCAIAVILGLTGRGQERPSLAAAVNAQQPHQKSASSAGTAGSRDAESEAASLRQRRSNG